MDSQEAVEEVSQVVGHQVAGKESHIAMGRLTGKLCEECKVMFISVKRLQIHKQEIHESYVFQLDKAQGIVIQQGRRVQQLVNQLDKAAEELLDTQKRMLTIEREKERLMRHNQELLQDRWKK